MKERQLAEQGRGVNVAGAPMPRGPRVVQMTSCCSFDAQVLNACGVALS